MSEFTQEQVDTARAEIEEMAMNINAAIIALRKNGIRVTFSSEEIYPSGPMIIANLHFRDYRDEKK